MFVFPITLDSLFKNYYHPNNYLPYLIVLFFFFFITYCPLLKFTSYKELRLNITSTMWYENKQISPLENRFSPGPRILYFLMFVPTFSDSWCKLIFD